MDKHKLLAHCTSAFNADKIMEIRDYLVQKETDFNHAPKDEREKKFARIGAALDEIRLDEKWYELWSDPSEELIEHLGAFLFVTYPVQIRHIKNQNSHIVPWHQDAGYMKLLGEKSPGEIVTCWVPLEQRPSLHSTVEFSKVDFEELDHVSQGDHGATLSDTFEDIATFDLDCGDCVVFGDLIPHRTRTSDHLNPERYSFEFRMVTSSQLKPGKDYFDIISDKFIKI